MKTETVNNLVSLFLKAKDTSPYTSLRLWTESDGEVKFFLTNAPPRNQKAHVNIPSSQTNSNERRYNKKRKNISSSGQSQSSPIGLSHPFLPPAIPLPPSPEISRQNIYNPESNLSTVEMEREEYTYNLPCRNRFDLLNEVQQPDADDDVPEPDLHQPVDVVPSLQQTISDRPGAEPEPVPVNVPVNDPVGDPSNPSMKYDLLPNGYLTSKTDGNYIFGLCGLRSCSLCKLHSETKPLAYVCVESAVCECLKIHWHLRSTSCIPNERAHTPFYNEADVFNPADFSA